MRLALFPAREVDCSELRNALDESQGLVRVETGLLNADKKFTEGLLVYVVNLIIREVAAD